LTVSWLRRTAVLAASVVGALALLVPTASAAQPAPAAAPPPALLPAVGLDQCSAAFFHDDRRLGPAQLPVLGPVGLEVIGYHRTGFLSADAFLARYYDPTANGGQGGYIFPPDNGYVIAPNGQPIEFQQQLGAGLQIDRFGSEFGAFLAPRGLPYAARSIPPQSLDGNPAAGCNYHAYRVLKPFTVDAGPIAAWFAQPGGGWQYQLDSALVPGAPTPLNVGWLVNNGYLARVIG
jgi:hypothetical protein